MQVQSQCPRCGAPLYPSQTQCQRCGTYVNNAYGSNNTYNPHNPNGNYRQYGNGHPSQQWLNDDAFAAGPEGKSRGVTALLAILVGTLGVQYFYLGKVGAGLLTILLCAVTCGIWSILVLIQGILMFCMDNNTFRNKYVITQSWFPLF